MGKDENYEELSMTREFKYKDMREAILNESKGMNPPKKSSNKKNKKSHKNNNTTRSEKYKNSKIEKNQDLEVKNIKDDLIDTKEIKLEEIKKDKVDDIVSDIKKDDLENTNDIYLTQSLKPIKKRPHKLRKVFRIIFGLALFVLVVFGLLHYAFKPLYDTYLNTLPEAIFSNTFDSFDENINNIFTGLDKGTRNYNFRIDTNIRELESLNIGEYQMIKNYDGNNLYGSHLFVKDGDLKYGLYTYKTKDNYYTKYSTIDTILKKDTPNSIVSYDDEKYFLTKMLDIFQEGIEDIPINVKLDELDITGRKEKVRKNTLKLDAINLRRIDKVIYENVLKDERLVKVFCYLYQIEEEELKKELDATNTYSDSTIMTINIYSRMDGSLVGFDVEEDYFRILYYYAFDDRFVFHVNLNDFSFKKDKKKDCLIDLVAIKREDYTDINVKLNGKVVGDIRVNSFEEYNIDVLYNLNIDDIIYKGSMVGTRDDYTLKLNIHNKDKYFNIVIDNAFNSNNFVDMNMFDKAVVYTDELFENNTTKFFGELKSANLHDEFLFYMDIANDPEKVITLLKNSTEKRIEDDSQ